MKKILSIKDLSLSGKKVLVRVDYNVPLTETGEVADNTRIKASLPTIEYLLSKNCSLVLMSHLGRPKQGFSKELSLKPVADELSRLLKRPVALAPDCIGKSVEKMAQENEILLLENLRFHEAEENPEKDPTFAKQLASLGDYYINDAFGSAHRAHASIVEVPRLFPGKSAPGFLMEKEIAFLGEALKNPERPFLALIGGAKISSKFGVLKALSSKVDILAIGGGMAFTFFKAQGISVGNSLVEDSFLEKAKEILNSCKGLLLPEDIVIAKSMEETKTEIISIKDGIPDGWMGLDIGPVTVQLFSEAIAKAKTILWNGPMGVFEKPSFAKGTEAIAKSFQNASAITIAGGGETVSALSKIEGKEKISHISTGGGASLEYLEFGTLPGISILENRP